MHGGEARATVVPRVAVSDPLPLFRRGVMAVLNEAGFGPESPDDLMAWARVDEPRIVLLTVVSPDDWALLSELSRVRADLTVVALLDEGSVVAQVRAITAGAAGVVLRHASWDSFRVAFEMVVQGASILPLAVVRALGDGFAPRTPAPISRRPARGNGSGCADWPTASASPVSPSTPATRNG
jgi:DNA-binding NarL/FixJ family response regulator